MSKTHAIVGSGTAPEKVIVEGLRDALNEGDSISLVWTGKPTKTEEIVYDYILELGFPFTMYYEEGKNPARIFRESENGIVQKVRNANKAAVKDATGSVLFLWDNDAEDDQVDFVFDFKSDDVIILELTNGLAPITDGDIPEPQEQEVEKDEADPEDDAVFSKEELENMTAYVVKRYGERLGLKATTKSGIIAELFPDDEDTEQPEPAGVVIDVTELTGEIDPRFKALVRSLSYIVPSDEAKRNIEDLRAAAIKYAELVALVTEDSRERSLAFTHIEDSLMWAIKAVCLQDSE